MPVAPTQVTTTWGSLIARALRDCGYLGIGQDPLGEDTNEALDRLQDLVAQWERQRWLIYHLVEYTCLSTGQTGPYTVGPTGGGFAPQISLGTFGSAVRPNRIEKLFFRQLLNNPQGPLDYPMRLMESYEDYTNIALKGLTNFGLCGFYDPAWPLGNLYIWPWPLANIYAIGLLVREQLGTGFALGSQVNLPLEYYRAIRTNLALELRTKYGIMTKPGDELPKQARASLNVLRSGNVAIGNLSMPEGLTRPGLYDIFSDQSY